MSKLFTCGISTYIIRDYVWRSQVYEVSEREAVEIMMNKGSSLFHDQVAHDDHVHMCECYYISAYDDSQFDATLYCYADNKETAKRFFDDFLKKS